MYVREGSSPFFRMSEWSGKLLSAFHFFIYRQDKTHFKQIKTLASKQGFCAFYLEEAVKDVTGIIGNIIGTVIGIGIGLGCFVISGKVDK